MKIGAIKESKNNEFRAGLVLSSVKELAQHGHQVYVQKGLGLGIGFSDEDYKKVGAIVVDTVEELFKQSEMLIKVKEPSETECKLLQEHHILFTYLHLAALPLQTDLLKKSRCMAIAYETVTSKEGSLPLLAPMSEVAGRLSILSGVNFLLKPHKGRGVLLNGVPGVSQGEVCILGAGVVGTNALITAVGMGAKITIIDTNIERLRQLDLIYGNKITTLYSSSSNIEESIFNSDLIVGAVLIPGKKAPKLVRSEHLKKMRKGAVLVDVAIDQGGCFETSTPTTYADPVFEKEGVLHYCVANMPGGVPLTSSFALNNATVSFILELANKGKKAIVDNSHLANGVNVYKGAITHKGLADSIGDTYVNVQELL